MPLSEEVKREVAKKIEEYEGRINHLYLDSVGKVTIGVGHLVANRNAVSSLMLYKSNGAGQLATVAERQAEYDNVAKQKKGFRASWYKQFTTLVMKDGDINLQRDEHIDSFYRYLTQIYRKSKGYPNDFDMLPHKVQMALFDMIFNLGPGRIVNMFRKFDEAIKAGDWTRAAEECNRPQVSVARNQYAKQLFQAAAREKG